MATIEVEKLIHQLEPKYLQELAKYLDYLLFVQKKQAGTNGKAEKKTAAKAKSLSAGEVAETARPADEDTPERLRIARQYFNTAPKPHFPVTKYDVYEQ